MLRQLLRTLGLWLLPCAILLAGLAGPGSSDGRPAAAAPAAPAQPTAEPTDDAPAAPVPCNLVAAREVSPRIVEENGGIINVKVTYNFNCVGGIKRLNFIILVEQTFAGNAVVRGDLLDNLKEGLKNFVNVTRFDNGTMGGMTLVGDSYTNRVPLRGDTEGKRELLEQIELISLKPIGSSAGFGQAINDAVGRLPTNVADAAENWLIIFDRGAPEQPQGNPEPPITIAEGCNRAHRSKVNVAVVSYPDAGGRMSRCATRGMYRGTSNLRGTELPTVFSELADAILRGKQARDTEYSDFVSRSNFTYVENSGRPREPNDALGNELIWRDRASSKPPSGYTIEYQWRAVEDSGGYQGNLSIASEISFLWPSGSPDKVVLEGDNNPTICIYRRNRRQQECGAFERSLTPQATAPAETPTPTPQPTTPPPPTATTPPPTVPPTETPTPTDVPVPSDTPVPTPTRSTGIYLPVLMRSFDRSAPEGP